MSEEVELVAKTSAEVVAALAEKSGALAVPSEYANYIAARIHLRHYPALVERAMTAAERITAAGLPRRAFAALDEPLLTAILEGMAEETDPSLQEMWENLLANTVTDGPTDSQRAHPQILRALDPVEAKYLSSQFTSAGAEAVRPHNVMKQYGLRDANLDNLERLGLIRYEMGTAATWENMTDLSSATRQVFKLTRLARELWRACQPPRPRD